MKKALNISIFLSALYILPLVLKLELIPTWPVLFSAVICSLLLATQPNMSAAESSTNKRTDKGTMWLILLMSAAGQVASILEWAYVADAPQHLDWISSIGAFLMIGGLAFRVWAIRTLDNAFSATVQIKQDQQLITSGPYKWFRHPSYTGAWILMLGVAILLHSYAGMLIMGPGMLWVYSKRINTEERTLEAEFGSAYREMKENTWRMLPGW